MCADGKENKAEEVRLVRDVVAKHKRRDVPVTQGSTPITQLAEAIEWFRHTRQLYVLDDKGRLLGNITLARLVMYTFAHSHETSMSPRHIMDLLTCETAAELMTESTLTATMDDDLDELGRNVFKRPVQVAVERDDRNEAWRLSTEDEILLVGARHDQERVEWLIDRVTASADEVEQDLWPERDEPLEAFRSQLEVTTEDVD